MTSLASPFAALARDWNYYSGLARTLWRVREVSPASDVLICDDFEQAVDKFADHTAILFEGERFTYRRLEELANRFAAWAEARGLKRGDSVALMLPNRGEYIAAWMGLAKRGVAAALINTNLTGAALAHSLSISDADHAITDVATLDAFDTMRVQLARPLTLWVMDCDRDLSDTRKQLDLKHPIVPPARPPRACRAGIKAGDTALYIYTSGTTGMPKAAKITHARAQLYMRAFAGATNTSAEDRLYCALPLYHSTGGLCGVGAALLNGATLVLRRRFSASQFWTDVSDLECTVFVYIGELCRYLVNQAPHPKERAHHLRLAFGNGLRPDVWEEFEDRFGAFRVLEFYGSTEGNASLFNFDGKKGAVGRVPHILKNNFGVYLVKFDFDAEEPIRNADGFCVECDANETGEAIGRIKDDGRSAYTGYADKKASDRKVMHDVFEKGDKWFRTGDLMRQDRDGYFYFVDRIGDTFRWKGENVSTMEVAEALAHYPGVAEVNVYGIAVPGADGRAGMAAITPETGFDIKGLKAFLAERLPPYARPLFVRLQPQIETTGTFKYRKMDLVAEGFDPAKIEQALYFDEPDTPDFTPLTDALYTRIQNREFRL
jgi:fatty-acyl-CoA synthase